MKKFLLIFFILHFSFCNAQNTNPIPCPTDKNYKWGIGVQVNTIDKFFPFDNVLAEGSLYDNDDHGNWKNNSFSMGLTGSYCLNETFSLRLKGGFTNVNRTYHRDISDETQITLPPTPRPPGAIFDQTTKQTRNYFSPEIIAGIYQK